MEALDCLVINHGDVERENDSVAVVKSTRHSNQGRKSTRTANATLQLLHTFSKCLSANTSMCISECEYCVAYLICFDYGLLFHLKMNDIRIFIFVYSAGSHDKKFIRLYIKLFLFKMICRLYIFSL